MRMQPSSVEAGRRQQVEGRFFHPCKASFAATPTAGRCGAHGEVLLMCLNSTAYEYNATHPQQHVTHGTTQHTHTQYTHTVPNNTV